MTSAAPKPESLAARPGWAELREAADELHAAELLVGDPIATPATAIPHLREYWRAVAEAADAAGIPQPERPTAWLEAAARQPPGKRELRAQVKAARGLLARLEPEIGGTPLYRRKRRILWSSVAAAVLFTPIALYLALHVEIPGTGPWRAAYHADKEFGDKPIIVREDSVEHDWNDTAPHEKIAPDMYSVRWDTCVRIEQSGPVVLQVNANDGARVLVDGETIIDAWDKNPKTGRRGFGSGELELEPGIHHLRVEFYEKLGDANIKLSASFDGSLPGPIPRERLIYPGDEIDEQDPCAAVR